MRDVYGTLCKEIRRKFSRDSGKMLNIANRVLRDRKPGDKIVIVVSAMGDSTDDLLDLAAKVSDVNYARERDMLLSTGEQVSIALMAMTFKKLVPAIS